MTIGHNITRQEDFEGTPDGKGIGGGSGLIPEGFAYEGPQSLSRRIPGDETDHGFDYTYEDEPA